MRSLPLDNLAKSLPLASVIGVLYFGLVILLLSTLTTLYSPVTQPASDYGVGPYAIEMNTGFFIGGVGVICFALAISSASVSEDRRSRAGGVLVFVAGLVLMMDSYFTTDITGPTTTHGFIHALGGFFFFSVGNVGILLVARKFGRIRLVVTVVALLVGFYVLSNPALGGLGERLVLLVMFSSIIVDSLSIVRGSG